MIRVQQIENTKPCPRCKVRYYNPRGDFSCPRCTRGHDRTVPDCGHQFADGNTCGNPAWIGPGYGYCYKHADRDSRLRWYGDRG